MFVIARRHEQGAEWLASIAPQNWGDRDQAVTFLTLNEARRAAATIKLSGDWSALKRRQLTEPAAGYRAIWARAVMQGGDNLGLAPVADARFGKLGHCVRLIALAYVKPFVKRQKNDAADAEAICEAAQPVIAISDTGIGMSPDEITIALEPFGQVDNGLAKLYEGTGIGLPLAKRLVELHGGKLAVESVRDVGTTIRVYLPANRVVAPTEIASVMSAA